MKSRSDVSEFWSFVSSRTSGKVREETILFAGVVGSQALGLGTEASDFDVRCVFSNTKAELLGVHPFDYFDIKEGSNRINYSGHFDGSGYSVPRFLLSLYRGDANAFELLYTPANCLIHLDSRLEPLLLERGKFVTGLLAKSLNGEARYLHHRAFTYDKGKVKHDDRRSRIEQYGYDVKAASKAYYHYRAAQRVLRGEGFTLLGSDGDSVRSIRQGDVSLSSMQQILQSEDERTHAAVKDRKQHQVPWQVSESWVSNLSAELTLNTWRDM